MINDKIAKIFAKRLKEIFKAEAKEKLNKIREENNKKMAMTKCT